MGGTLDHLLAVRARRGAGYLALLDPDRLSLDELAARAGQCAEAGVDAILVGTSLMLSAARNAAAYKRLRQAVDIPLISFPGDAGQVVPAADAILFLCMVSGRNPELLIGQQARAAPLLKEYGVELPDGFGGKGLGGGMGGGPTGGGHGGPMGGGPEGGGAQPPSGGSSEDEGGATTYQL